MAMMKEEPFCSMGTQVTMTTAVTRSAREWAEAVGLPWETVRRRRYRGASWSEALRPGLRRSNFNNYKERK